MKTITALIASAALLAITVPPAAGAQRHRHRHRPIPQAAEAAEAAAAETVRAPLPPVDDLYRRRGYGMGGPVFGGNIGQAGTCAELAFADPASCGAKGGIGIYGNGLTYPFGR